MAAILTSGLRESKVRISAPNFLFATVASGIVSKHGVLGISFWTSLTGVFLIFLAGTGLATAVRFIPRAIVAGLLSGVAVLVVVGPIADLLGTTPTIHADDAQVGLTRIFHYASLTSPSAAIMATGTLILTLLGRKLSVLIPASLIATITGALLVKLHHLSVLTVGSSNGFGLWLFHPFTTGSLRLDLLGDVLGPAFAIAILSAFQSLAAL